MAVLMTLLARDFRNIYVGPRPPTFLSPNMLEYFRQMYNLRFIRDPKDDLEAMLAGGNSEGASAHA